MFGRHLQLIRISEDRAAVKRGLQELLFTGPGVAELLEMLLPLLDGRSRHEILDEFPESFRPPVESVLDDLLARRLVTEDEPGPPPGDGLEALQQTFWSHFGEHAHEEVPRRLRDATVVVVGVNLVTRSLVRSLLETGIGRVTVVHHPVLDQRLVPFDPAGWRGLIEREGGGPLTVLDEIPDDDLLAEAALWCVGSDLGCADALLEWNRRALNLDRPYLPLWLEDLFGQVGPLVQPFSSACLRCFQLRTDSHQADREVARAVRTHVASRSDAREGAGMLPPMAGVLGEIAAMEVLKLLGGFTFSDAVGRAIEINLLSFASAVRRVLKLPRCPECSEMMRWPTQAVTLGPQIPGGE